MSDMTDYRQDSVIKTFKCGDDEDTLMVSLDACMSYYATGKAMGWRFNPKKQMISSTMHEFLQLMLCGEEGMTQSMISCLCSFIDGSWFKDGLLDWSGSAQNIHSTALTLIRRGANAHVLSHLARKMTNVHYRKMYGHDVLWTVTMDKDMCQRFGYEKPNEVMIKGFEMSRNLDRAIRDLNTPGVHDIQQKWWPVLSLVPEGERSRLVHDEKISMFKSWFSTEYNMNSTPPEIPRGKVKHPTFVERNYATLQQDFDNGVHMTQVSREPTIRNVSGITGIPVSVLRAIRGIPLSQEAHKALRGYSGYLEDETMDTTQHIHKLDSAAVWSVAP